MRQLLTWFMEGGPVFMSVLTVLLVALFFAAWKAPRWVKEIGIFALVFGFLGTVLGLQQILTYLQEVAVEKGEGVTGIFDLIAPPHSLGRREDHPDSRHQQRHHLPGLYRHARDPEAPSVVRVGHA